MKTQLELNQIDIDIDFYDNQSIVKGFLLHSALNRMHEFDFEEAFDYLLLPIISKLNEHAQLGYDSFLEYYEDVFSHSDSDFEPFTYSTDYLYISIDDVKEAIAKMHYDKSVEAFGGMFDNLIYLKERIENLSNLSMQQRIILFDEVIHAQHVTGDIYEDLNIEDIKSDLDADILELMGIEVY